MHLCLIVGGHRISVVLNGGACVAENWKTHVSSHSIPDDSLGSTDIQAQVDLVPGWFNKDKSKKTIFSNNETNQASLRTEGPFGFGTLGRNGTKIDGVFTINGDVTQHIDAVTSQCLAALCEQRGDILLHSSCIVKGDMAFVFAGPGGYGKTTIAQELNAGGEAISVDKTLIQVTSNGSAIAHSTPFGDTDGTLRGSRKAQIAGLFFIEQSKSTELVPLSPWSAIKLLFANATLPFGDRDSVNSVMETAGSTIDSVPAYRLSFEKNESFWSLIESSVGKGV